MPSPPCRASVLSALRPASAAFILPSQQRVFFPPSYADGVEREFPLPPPDGRAIVLLIRQRSCSYFAARTPRLRSSCLLDMMICHHEDCL